MLNLIWSLMILAGMLWGACCGNLEEVTQGLLDSSKEAVSLGITMLGLMSFWCGILNIGQESGLIGWLSEKMDPILDFLFPELERKHPARKPIAVNIIANMLGLGMAATPAGLEAMKLMAKKEESGEQGRNCGEIKSGIGMLNSDEKGITATNSMCTFLILNISSLQLVPVNLVAYRSEYGSSNPAAVIGPAFAATLCSTLAAVVFCKVMDILNGRGAVARR